MKLAVLTSSRADYGIYKPLLKALNEDAFFELHLIVFGTHLSAQFGYSVSQITEDGYIIDHELDTMPEGDDPAAISKAMAKCMDTFTQVWERNDYDLVIALGDRYEMLAAVLSGKVFNIRFAHLHGGETTLGAIDDAFRHAITMMSDLHFASTETYRQRIIQLKASDKKVFNTGFLGIDYLKSVQLFSKEEFIEKFGIDLSRPFILSTIHPETVAFENNENHVDEFVKAAVLLEDFKIIITMPNADTSGMVIRKKLQQLASTRKNIVLVENFGSVGYLSCMKYCEMLLGNTSSGFYDASFFPKWVINLGRRQDGRLRTPNIVDVGFNAKDIVEAVKAITGKPVPVFEPVYGCGDAASKIIKILKDEFRSN